MHPIYLSFIFSILLFSSSAFAKKDRIKLRDVGALTFYQNEFTKSRRSNSIPQLRCIGGTARCEFSPKVVQCSNSGFDGSDVQWQCKADMKNKYSFGKIFVNCEGFDYPDDDYIFAGSCGLEYELDYSGKTYEKQWSSKGSTERSYESSNGVFGFGFIVFAVCAIALIYCCLPKSGERSRPEPSAPPPPGFHSGIFDDNYSGYGSSSCGYERRSGPTSSTASNLWSGAIGAGLGYMLGRNSSNTNPYTDGRYTHNRDYREQNDSSEEVRNATGFATTKRR